MIIGSSIWANAEVDADGDGEPGGAIVMEWASHDDIVRGGEGGEGSGPEINEAISRTRRAWKLIVDLRRL
jgi:hypothetical protein